MNSFNFTARIYDWTIESLLERIKQRVARFVVQYRLFPILDICCGTGKQCYLIGNREQTIGLDLDAKIIKYATSKYPLFSYLCADAGNIPIRDESLNGIVISYALHDKTPKFRRKIMDEAKRLLTPEGKIILVDFERPWNRQSQIGYFFIYFIERLAGAAHFRNGRQFLEHGGLIKFMKIVGLNVIERYPIELGCSSIIIARFH